MYIFFNRQGVLTTQIPHGEIVRQSGSLTFRFAFEDDYIFDLNNNSSNYTLTIAFKRPGDKEFGTTYVVPTSPVPKEEVFTKVKPSEMTYSFVDGKKYRFCEFLGADYDYITERPGEVQAVVRLLDKSNTPTDGFSPNVNVSKVLAQGLVRFNVERTYGTPYTVDLTLSQFNALVSYIDKQIGSIANAYIKSVNYNSTTTDITFILQDGSPYVINLNDFLDKQKGIPNGVATLDEDGKVPISQLLGGSIVSGQLINESQFLSTDGVTYDANAKNVLAHIYMDIHTDLQYRWNGTKFVVVANYLALGETSDTAYPGDKGALNRIDIDKAIKSIQNIINGTTPVGDSNKLGGWEASQYALKSEVQNLYTLPLASETELGGIKARQYESVETPVTEIVVNKITQKAYSEQFGNLVFDTDYATGENIEELKSIVITNYKTGAETKLNLPKIPTFNGDKIILDLTPFITIDRALNNGTIKQEGYDLVKNTTNTIFRLNVTTTDGSDKVLVLTKESSTPNIELSTRYYENQRYYLVKFTIKPSLVIDIGGVDFVTLEDLLKELMNYSTTKYVDQKITDLIGLAPDELNTLAELATAIENNGSVIEALNQAIANKQDKTDKNLSTQSKVLVEAINELFNDKQDKTDSELNTKSKTIVGAINEVNSKAVDQTVDGKYIPSPTEETNGGIKAKNVNGTTDFMNEIVYDTISGKAYSEFNGSVIFSTDYIDEANVEELKSIKLTNKKTNFEKSFNLPSATSSIKEIHLFGENRVMVPHDTKVTNIDLYCHMIHIKGSPTTGISNFDLYFEFYSSKNIPVNSIQDMKSLLGNGFYRSCNGLAMSKVVYAIYESNNVVKVKCTNTSEELLQGVDIEDMVKTI